MSHPLERHIIEHLKIGIDFYSYDTSDFQVINNQLTIRDSGIDHGSVSGLSDDDHPHYSLVDGTRAFTGTVSGITPTADTHLTTKAYVDIFGDHFVNMLTSVGDPSGFKNRDDSVISFDDVTRIFTIQPVGDSYEIWCRGGNQFIKTEAESITLPDTEGNLFVYFDENAVLQYSLSFAFGSDAILLQHAYVAVINWDVDNHTHIYFGDERHGLVMDWATHSYLHNTIGTKWVTGLALGDIITDRNGSLATHAEFSVSGGQISDEDLNYTYTDGNPQDIAFPAQIPIYYRTGATGVWRKKAANDFPLIYSGTAGYTGANGRAPFNQFSGGVWALTEATNLYFFLVHYFATNDIDEPIIGIQGQAQYSNIGNARAGAESEMDTLAYGVLPFEEFAQLATVIFQTASSYSNTPKSRIRSTSTGAEYIDWRGTFSRGSGGLAVSDHGLLSGLEDDDHPQYLLVANIDDVPVDGVIDAPISSNWAYDHIAAADPHTGYRLESADHNHQSTGVEAGQLDHGLALTGLTDDDHTQYLLLAGRSGQEIDDSLSITGSLGIGTATPAQLLEIYTTTNNLGRLRITATNTTAANYSGIELYGKDGGATTFGGGLFREQDDDSIQLWHSTGAGLTLLQNGRVGIKTTTPAQVLDVNGSAQIRENLLIGTASDSTATRYLEIGTGRTGSGYSYIDLIGDTTYTDYGLRIIRNDTGANANSIIGHRGTGELSLRASDAGSITAYTNGAVAMTINSSQRVGIGTTAPTSKLAVIGELGVWGSASDDEGIAFQTAYSNSNTSGRIFFAEADSNLYGFSLIYAGDTNPTFDGQAFSLTANTFNLVRHDNSLAGATVLSIARASGEITTANNLNIGGSSTSTQDRALQIGNDRTDSGYAYIDLVGDTTYTNYGLRIIRGNGGANTTSSIQHRGNGALALTAGTSSEDTNSSITLSVTDAQKLAVGSLGVRIGTGTPSQIFDVNDNSIRIVNSQSPAATDAGQAGQIAWDANYLYVCYGTNQWGRIVLLKGY